LAFSTDISSLALESFANLSEKEVTGFSSLWGGEFYLEHVVIVVGTAPFFYLRISGNLI
jgi:hypothetical protein